MNVNNEAASTPKFHDLRNSQVIHVKSRLEEINAADSPISVIGVEILGNPLYRESPPPLTPDRATVKQTKIQKTRQWIDQTFNPPPSPHSAIMRLRQMSNKHFREQQKAFEKANKKSPLTRLKQNFTEIKEDFMAWKKDCKEAGLGAIVRDTKLLFKQSMDAKKSRQVAPEEISVRDSFSTDSLLMRVKKACIESAAAVLEGAADASIDIITGTPG